MRIEFIAYHRRSWHIRRRFDQVSRWLGQINVVIDAVIASHMIITLHDLEHNMLLRLKEFKVSTFKEIGLGRLVCHEKVRRYFRPSSRLLKGHVEVPPISTPDVLVYLQDAVKEGEFRPPFGEKLSKEELDGRILAVLDDVAENEIEHDDGEDLSWRDLGIYVKALSVHANVNSVLEFLVRTISVQERVLSKRLYTVINRAREEREWTGLREASEWFEVQRTLISMKESDASNTGVPICNNPLCECDMTAGNAYGKACDDCGSKIFGWSWFCSNCSELCYCFVCIPAIGSKWEDFGTKAPTSGNPIQNEGLTDALRYKKEFTAEDLWDTFRVKNLSLGDFIKVDGQFLRPAGSDARDLAGEKGFWSGSPATAAVAVKAVAHGLKERARTWREFSLKKRPSNMELLSVEQMKHVVTHVESLEQSLAEFVAPVLVCAMRNMQPIGSTEAGAIIDYHSLEHDLKIAVNLALSHQRSQGRPSFALLKAEKAFLNVFGAQSLRDAPISLLQFIAMHEDLQTAVQAVCVQGNSHHSSGPAARDRTSTLDETNVGQHKCVEQQILEDIRTYFLDVETSEGSDSGQDVGHMCRILRNLSKCEERLCQVREDHHFQGFSGTSFLEFICRPQHVAEIEGLFCEMDRHSEGCPRLIQLVILMAQEKLKIDGANINYSQEDVVGVLESARDDALLLDSWSMAVEVHMGFSIKEFGFRNIVDLTMRALAYVRLGMNQSASAIDFLSSLSHLCLVQVGSLDFDTTDASRAEMKAASKADAVAKMNASPFLADLSIWLDWDASFLLTLGPLGSFISETMSLTDDKPWRIVDVTHGNFIKIPQDTRSKLEQDFLAAVPQNPLSAAAAAVGSFVSGHLSGGAQQQRRRMAEHVETQFKELDILEAAVFVYTCLFTVLSRACHSLFFGKLHSRFSCNPT